MFTGEIDINEGNSNNRIERINNKFLFHLRRSNRPAHKMRILHKALRPAPDAERIEVEVSAIESSTIDWIIKRLVEEQVVDVDAGGVGECCVDSGGY